MNLFLFIWVSLAVFSSNALAFSDGFFRVGLGWYQQNALGKITKSVDSSASISGASSYPLFIKYDFQAYSDWYVSPQLSYTPIGRDSADAATTTTLLQVVVPVGFDLYQWIESSLDWQIGVGINQYSMKGNGGSSALLNGQTPTTFQKPSGSSSSKTAVLLIGSSFNYGPSRFGLDFVFEGLFSEKRTPSISLNYSYAL